MSLETQSGQLHSRSNVVTGASASVLTPNSERSGLQITSDAAAGGVSLLLYTGADGSAANAGTASATAFDIFLAPSGSWPGTIGGVVWTGGVVAFGTGARIAILEA